MGIVYENEQPVERVILVGISERNGDDTESSLAELAELAATAGAEVVGTVIQNLEHMHPGTYVGTGKLEEIRDMIWEKEATGIICDDELSPIQMRNMEQVLDSKVMDRPKPASLLARYFSCASSTCIFPSLVRAPSGRRYRNPRTG